MGPQPTFEILPREEKVLLHAHICATQPPRTHRVATERFGNILGLLCKASNEVSWDRLVSCFDYVRGVIIFCTSRPCVTDPARMDQSAFEVHVQIWWCKSKTTRLLLRHFRRSLPPGSLPTTSDNSRGHELGSLHLPAWAFKTNCSKGPKFKEESAYKALNTSACHCWRLCLHVLCP